MNNFSVRSATRADAKGVLDIYGPIVEHTAISFEETVPVVSEIENRIEDSLKSHDYLVATTSETIAGYACGRPFRPKSAYRFSVEVSVYIGEDFRGSGVASLLYRELLTRLKSAGFRIAVAGIALPNPASVKLHEKFGFTRVGTFKDVGHKFDKWHDVEWWQRPLDGDWA